MRRFEKVLLIRQRQARRNTKRDRRRQGWRRLGLGLLAILAAAIGLAVIGLGWAYVEITSDLPAVDELAIMLDPQQGALLQPTRLYDRSGEHLIYSLENPGILRRPLPLDPARIESISPALIQTVLTMQDPDFLTQPMLRLNGLNNPQPETIAEKLVDELLLYYEAPSLRKTLRLRLLANQALTRFGRLQILEWYLNNASFGHLAYGADAAAQLYLGKPASQLDWAEAAMLVAVLDAPVLNPLDAPAAALERQQNALRTLLDAGVIDNSTYTQAVQEEMVFRSDAPAAQSPALAFSQLALEQLAERIDRRRLERGGLRVITSLDYNLQTQLNCAVRAQLARLSNLEEPTASDQCLASQLLPGLPLDASQTITSPPLTSSALILDPENGQVLALAGDTTLLEGEGSMLQNRPAGSLTSPILALTGFARALSPASLVWDIPASLEGYANPDGKFLGPLSLRSALVNNRLTPLTQTLLQIGPVHFLDTAHSLGVNSLKLPADARDTFLGISPVDPLETAFAFSVFANLGMLNGQVDAQSGQIESVLALRVEDSIGRVLLSNEVTQSQSMVSPQLAYLVHDLLSDDPARWPSLGYPNPLETGRPSGVFAAQTADGSSTWVVGYTRQHLALVWLGAENGQNSQRLDPRLAGGIWHALIQYASRDLPIENWQMPSGLVRLEVCSPSGLLPTAQCPLVVNEIFLAGSQPVVTDNLYSSYQINRETNRLATIFTPAELIENRTYLVVPPEAQEWAQQAGLPVPPVDYDPVQAPAVNPDASFSSPTQFSVARGEIVLQGSAAGAGFLSYNIQVGQGINPTNWLTIHENTDRPVVDGLLGHWDTSGLEGLFAIRLQVVHTGQRIETAVLQVTVDNTPPQAAIPYPQPGQTFDRRSQTSIIFQADVQDNVGIQSVEWQLDGRKIGERLSAPFAVVWDATPGEHTLQIQAVDLAGNQGRSEEITFTVK